MARMSDKDKEQIEIGICEEIASGLIRMHINRSELAHKCGIPNSTLAHRFKYPGTFRIDELLAISNVINISFIRLCGKAEASHI